MKGNVNWTVRILIQRNTVTLSYTIFNSNLGIATFLSVVFKKKSVILSRAIRNTSYSVTVKEYLSIPENKHHIALIIDLLVKSPRVISRSCELNLLLQALAGFPEYPEEPVLDASNLLEDEPANQAHWAA